MLRSDFALCDCEVSPNSHTHTKKNNKQTKNTLEGRFKAARLQIHVNCHENFRFVFIRRVEQIK
jgi:hypothetical protein